MPNNIPISSLPVAIALDGSEQVPIVQAGITKRTTIDGIASTVDGFVPTTRRINTIEGIAGGGTLEADLTLKMDVASLSQKTTPVVGDSIAINDSATGQSAATTFGNAYKTIGGLPSAPSVNTTEDSLALFRAADQTAYKVTPFQLIAGVVAPGGADGDIQFNDNGTFGGDGRMSFDKITGVPTFSPNAPTTAGGFIINFNTSQPDVFAHQNSLRIIGADNDFAGIYFNTWGLRSIVNAYLAGGTAAAPTATPSGAEIHRFSARGFDGTNFTGSTSSVSFFAGGEYTPTSQPGWIGIRTTAVGQTGGGSEMRPPVTSAFAPSGGMVVGPSFFSVITQGIDLLVDPGAGVLQTEHEIRLSGATINDWVSLKAPSATGTFDITLPAGTTDFSATGGTSQVVKQTTAGGAFTVGQLSASDVIGAGPGGSNGQIMYNDGGAFNGDASMTFDNATKYLTLQRLMVTNGINYAVALDTYAPQIYRYSDNNGPAALELMKSRGTPSARLHPEPGDTIGLVGYKAYDGFFSVPGDDGYAYVGRSRVILDAFVGEANLSGYYTIDTRNVGEDDPHEGFRVSRTRGVSIGDETFNGTDPGAGNLAVQGGVSANTFTMGGAGLGTAATANTGTSGHTLPFLDGVNTWSGAQTFTALNSTNNSTYLNQLSGIQPTFGRYANAPAAGTNLFLKRFRGTVLSPTGVLNGDKIGELDFLALAATGGTEQIVTNVASFVDTVNAATDISSYLIFATRPNGAGAAATEAVRVSKNQGVSIGDSTFNATDPGAGVLAVQSGLQAAKVFPATDSVSAVQITKADKTTVVGNWDTTNGRLGIGTATPASTLDIRVPSGVASFSLVANDTSSTAVAQISAQQVTGPSIAMSSLGSSASNTSLGSIPNSGRINTISPSGSGGITIYTANVSAPIRFGTGGTAFSNERMRISATGGISVGNDTFNATDPGAGNLAVKGTTRLGGFTVATLPAAGTVGRMAYVTDATAPTYLGALTGGGSVVTPVFDNGTAWVAA